MRGNIVDVRDTALRFGKFFKTSPEFRMNIQVAHDIKIQARPLEEVLAGIPEVEQLRRNLTVASESHAFTLRPVAEPLSIPSIS
ncbi:hypothetical protein [Rhizobium mongolense]|uniref:Plasmid maintenance system antidote protein VapI n=2 Tax=Rhizobium mongolense TaxID=57676 RepID=A0A7W6RLA7_9HYPH|nr:hypothetical protein [Rhizobium mongolense]MBB4274008.1 plasmid maintenance system antidote protein VapI [Rhizobium mongolense]